MDYQMFKEQLAALLKRKAGDDFEVKVESVQKLNGIEKEAFAVYHSLFVLFSYGGRTVTPPSFLSRSHGIPIPIWVFSRSG